MSCYRGPLWAPALGTASPPRCSPKPQSAGRCAVERATERCRRPQPVLGSRWPAVKPAVGGSGCESTGTRAHAAFRPAKVTEPARGLSRSSRARVLGVGPQRSGRGRNRGGCARVWGEGGGRCPAAAYPAQRRRSVLPSLLGPPGPPAAEGGACPSPCPQLGITETAKSTRSPNSLKSTSSHQPLICIPEVAPRSPVRAPLCPPSPRSSPAGRYSRFA